MQTELAMYPGLPGRLFTGELAAREPMTEFRSAGSLARLGRTEILVTGWGSPRLDAAALAAAPLLRAVVHAAGSVKEHLDPAVFARGVVVSSAATVNAIPVAEYTLAAILLANKAVPALTREYRERKTDLGLLTRDMPIGNLGRTVGIVGASRTGRRVLRLLRPFALHAVLADPYVGADEAAGLGARLVELDELVATADVVSLHAPAIPATRHMLDARRLRLMRDGATLVNTARGSLVDQDALIAELRTGRISAVLDVTEPEVTPPGDELWGLPNVILTPHVAGSLGGEVARLGAAAQEEIRRLRAGEPPLHPVDPSALATLA